MAQDLADAQWAFIEPLLPELPRRADGRGRPWRDSREVLNGILWILRTGAQWSEMPSRYPPYQTCHRRFQQWRRAGVMDRLLRALAQDLERRGKIKLDECFIDGSFSAAKKGGAGHVFPELFRRHLTDKDNEAVANPAKFRGEKGARALAGRDYQERMAAIFAECRRVLKPNGIMTLMFTHKATGAWDALTKGLMEAGFAISASWPVHTEPEGSLHIRNKAAAKTTIFMVCRPRNMELQVRENLYWEDVEPRVAQAVRQRVAEFQGAGITGVDLYLASFGPALEEFSRQWPLRRGTPREIPEERQRRRQHILFEDEWDPYAATPEDALHTARREVKRWRLQQLTHLKADADLDPATAFFVLAWDAFEAPIFAYDEALRLARAVGVDLERDVVGRLAQKKGSDLWLWDSAYRAAKDGLGPADGSRGMIDAIHHASNIARIRSLAAAREMLEDARIDNDPRFLAALEAVLEVLPVSKPWTGIELAGESKAAGDDFEALYSLARLAYRDKIDEPEQLRLWRTDST